MTIPQKWKNMGIKYECVVWSNTYHATSSRNATSVASRNLTNNLFTVYDLRYRNLKVSHSGWVLRLSAPLHYHIPHSPVKFFLSIFKKFYQKVFFRMCRFCGTITFYGSNFSQTPLPHFYKKVKQNNG